MYHSIKWEFLTSIHIKVSNLSNVPIARNKPVLGDGNFTRGSGIGIQYVMHDPLVMFGTHPALTGRVGEVVLGKKSGKASIAYKLDMLGLGEASDEENAEILDLVKQAGIKKRDILTDDEFKAIAVPVLSRKAAWSRLECQLSRSGEQIN